MKLLREKVMKVSVDEDLENDELVEVS